MSKLEYHVAVIIPTYNERGSILSILRAVRRALPAAALIVVDDSSPDETALLVRAVSQFDAHTYLVSNPQKAGRGAAVRVGFRWAHVNTTARVFVEMDADYSHQPDELPSLVAVAESGQVAIASRYIVGSRIEGWPVRRHVFSRLSNTCIQIVLGLRLHDATNGFRAYPRCALERLIAQPLVCRSFMSLSEVMLVLAENTIGYTEVASRFVNRNAGNSNTTPKEILANIRELALLWYRHRWSDSVPQSTLQ